ncbi:MAG: 16S rRNA (guanine(966)-N(2))-methyltransferase RsmD [Wenzhouxiangella sp.]
MHGKIRIISGRWRGRKLTVADAPGLRPTGDRARETLFNWLGPRVIGARCLDLFSGSGALGLEAVSRGAASAVLVERSASVMATLREQVGDWPDINKVQFVQADVLAWLDSAIGPFDVVFIDPPFEQALQQAVLERLLSRGLLAEDGRVYLESPGQQDELDLAALALPIERLRSKNQGQIRMDLLARTAAV